MSTSTTLNHPFSNIYCPPSPHIVCFTCSNSLPKSSYSTRQIRRAKKAALDSNSELNVSCVECNEKLKDINTTTTLVPWHVGCDDQDDGCLLYVTVIPQPIQGLLYYPSFLTPSESERVMGIVDVNGWSREIKRRQQFYGVVYYHTTRDYKKLQPKMGGEGGGRI